MVSIATDITASFARLASTFRLITMLRGRTSLWSPDSGWPGDSTCLSGRSFFIRGGSSRSQPLTRHRDAIDTGPRARSCCLRRSYARCCPHLREPIRRSTGCRCSRRISLVQNLAHPLSPAARGREDGAPVRRVRHLAPRSAAVAVDGRRPPVVGGGAVAPAMPPGATDDASGRCSSRGPRASRRSESGDI